MKVAVYGTLKRGWGANHFLETSMFLGTTTLPGTMYSLGLYPGVVLDNKSEFEAEVFELASDKLIDRLDSYEGNGYLYNRRTIDTEFGPAEIYEYALEVEGLEPIRSW